MGRRYPPLTKPEVLAAAQASGGQFRAKPYMAEDMKAAKSLVRDGLMRRRRNDKFGWCVFEIVQKPGA